MPVEHISALEAGKEGKVEVSFETTTELAPWDERAELTVVGKRHTRVEGADKVTGRARYAYDIRLPGQLYARVLRSPHPHARVLRVDTSKAAALPGVHAVLGPDTMGESEWYEEKVPLFSPVVRFVGEEVAAVAAESDDIAEDAIRLIEVEYEPLPFVIEMKEALRPDAPPIHEGGNHVGEPDSYERGDVEAGFREAELIIEQTYTTQTALHNSLEPHGCTASWEGDELTLWDSTQGVWEVRKMVAERVGLPEHHVRVIKHFMGGGFGSKQIAWKHTVIAALLSKQAGRPVQLMLDRKAENLASGNRNATEQHVRIGATRDGTLTAIEVDITLAVGAYMVGGEASNVVGPYQRLYHCPNVRTRQVGAYINAGPSVAFRAPGHVEGAFALESALDEVARQLDIDPVELRRRNYAERDQKKEQPFTTPQSLRLCYEKATAAFGWDSYQKAAPHGSKRRGIGFAAHDWGGAGSPPAYAWVQLNSDGTAEVVTATQDIGTGTRTGLSQVAAEELGLPIEKIHLVLGDTARGPYSPTSSGSTTQASVGPAVRAAAAEARRQLIEVAAKVLEEPAERLRVFDGVIFVADQPQTAVTVAEVTGRIAPHMIQGYGARGPNVSDKTVRTWGAQCIEVEVDVETGEVTILRIAASHDCGRIINPTLVESQVIGGITQGIGFALTEERIVDAGSGIVLNPNLEEYKVPTVADIPPIHFAALNLPDPGANSTGVKGIGEPPLIPTAPAIANAIFDATGLRLRDLPLSRHRLVAALAELENGTDTGGAV